MRVGSGKRNHHWNSNGFTNAVVPNVKITLTNTATGQVRKSTSNTPEFISSRT